MDLPCNHIQDIYNTLYVLKSVCYPESGPESTCTGTLYSQGLHESAPRLQNEMQGDRWEAEKRGEEGNAPSQKNTGYVYDQPEPGRTN